MKKRNLFFLIMLSIFTFLYPLDKADAAQVVKPGANSGDVWDLQYRLQLLGYYSVPLDGIYGHSTTRAVRSFQRDYGLPVDGVVGKKTWNTLKKNSVNANELTLLAKLVHSEARGEPYMGKVSVAAVVMNRLQSPQFPNTLRGVIFQKGAFTAVDDGQFWLTPDKSAYKAAWEAARGWDPSSRALYYFNPKTATSNWIWTRPQIKKIGNHIFTR